MLAVPIPKPVGNFLDLMAAAAGPAALFAVGLSLVGRPLMGNSAEVGWLVLLKLGIYPIADPRGSGFNSMISVSKALIATFCRMPASGT